MIARENFDERTLFVEAVMGRWPPMRLLSILQHEGLCEYQDQYGRISWNRTNLRMLTIDRLKTLYSDLLNG